jgi:hypothetical protein
MDIYRKKPPLFTFGIEDLTPIGGAASALGGLISGFSSIGAGKRQRKAIQLQHDLNMQAYERQLADQRQLIDEEREYNDFSSVVARARAAGINPAAVLGSANGGNISTSTPNMETPDVSPLPSPLASVGAGLSSIGPAFNQSLLVKEQIRSQRLDNELKEKELGNKDNLIEQENTLRDLQNEFQGYQNSIAKIDSENAQSVQNAWFALDEENDLEPGTSYGTNVRDAQEAETTLKESQWANVQANTKVLTQQAENLKKQFDILKQEYDHKQNINPALVTEAYLQCEKLLAEIDSIGIADLMHVFNTLHNADLDIREFNKAVIELKHSMNMDVAEFKQKDVHKLMDSITTVASALIGLVGLSFFKSSTPPKGYKPNGANVSGIRVNTSRTPKFESTSTY